MCEMVLKQFTHSHNTKWAARAVLAWLPSSIFFANHTPTTTITAADRIAAWDVRFIRSPPSDRAFAGCFQPRTSVNHFLTWVRLIHDPRPYLNPSHCPEPVMSTSKDLWHLVLWLRRPISIGGGSANLSTSTTSRPQYIYLGNPVGISARECDPLLTPHRCSTLGTGVDYDEGEDSQAPTTLNLTLVFHDCTFSLPAWDPESHLAHGMSTLFHRYQLVLTLACQGAPQL